eukprot:4595102-Pleurochrysis_carterae.AAC.1
MPPPGPPQATTSFGRFGGYISGPAGTWSRRSICAAPYMGCSSSLSRSTGLRPSFCGANSPCPSPLPPPRCFLSPARSPTPRASLLATLCLLYVSGFRKAGLIANLPERGTWLTRASLLWVIGGDRCEVSPRQSKCSATGEVWDDRPIALAYIDVPGNAAKALAHLELEFPVEASARERTPLLTADNATPLTPS